MIWGWATLAVAGLALIVWASVSLPEGTSLYPVRIAQRTTRGPYRWLSHPMYVGNVALVSGLAGVAGGFWNALAIGTLADMVMREWAGRETGASSGDGLCRAHKDPQEVAAWHRG